MVPMAVRTTTGAKVARKNSRGSLPLIVVRYLGWPVLRPGARVARASWPINSC